MKLNIAKYAFNSREQFQDKFDALHTVDEEGNSIPNFRFGVVQLGHILLEAATFNEEGEELTEEVLSVKWHVDVAWFEQEDHPYGWKSYNVNLTSEGMHGFAGLSYLQHKFDE